MATRRTPTAPKRSTTSSRSLRAPHAELGAPPVMVSITLPERSVTPNWIRFQSGSERFARVYLTPAEDEMFGSPTAIEILVKAGA
jgi:hypothetical protein